MGKEVKIIIPDDCVLVQTGEGKWEVRKIKNKLPKTWDEFCETYPISKGFIIDNCSMIKSAICGFTKRKRHPSVDKNVLPDMATAEAVLALMQLIQLRNFYNGDWKPDWTDYNIYKYVIVNDMDEVKILANTSVSHVLSFKSKELATEFLENFKILINIAKPLI